MGGEVLTGLPTWRAQISIQEYRWWRECGQYTFHLLTSHPRVYVSILRLEQLGWAKEVGQRTHTYTYAHTNTYTGAINDAGTHMYTPN